MSKQYRREGKAVGAGARAHLLAAHETPGASPGGRSTHPTRARRSDCGTWRGGEGEGGIRGASRYEWTQWRD